MRLTQVLLVAVTSCGAQRAPTVSPRGAPSADATVSLDAAAPDATVADAATPHSLAVTDVGSAKLTGWATGPVFTPDGAEVCLLVKDSVLRCFDASSLHVIQHPGGTIKRATDAMIVIGTRAFDAKTGAELAFPLPKAGGCQVASFSRDGSKVLADCSDPTEKALVWDARSGALLVSTPRPNAYASPGWGELTPSGNYFRWTVKAVGVTFENITTHAKSRLTRAASSISPDDRFTYMANVDDQDAELLDASGRSVMKFKGDAFDVTFSPSSRLFAVARAKLEPCPTCSGLEPRFVGPTYAVTLHSVGHDGTLATVHTSGTVAFSPDDTKLALIEGDTLRVCNLQAR